MLTFHSIYTQKHWLLQIVVLVFSVSVLVSIYLHMCLLFIVCVFTRRPVPLCMTGTLSSPVRVLISSLVGSLQRCLLCFGRSTKPCNRPAPDWKRRKTGNTDNNVTLQQGGRNQTYMSKCGQIHAVARVLSQPLHQTFTGRFPVDGDNLWLRRGLGGSGSRS